MKCKYEGSGVWEGRCVGTKEVDPCVGIEKCDRYKPNCPTNADRVRAMSDEELAAFMDAKPLCPDKELSDKCPFNCRVCWGKWLKQPVKDGDNDG